MRVSAPASAAVSVRVGSGMKGQVDGVEEIAGEVSCSKSSPVFASTSSRSASLRKKIVSFVFDKTRKHGRFMPVGTGGIRTRRSAERSTV